MCVVAASPNDKQVTSYLLKGHGMTDNSASRPGRRLRAVDVERLENTSFVSALGLQANGTEHQAACNGCTVASCIGITCTGGGACVTAGPCLVLTLATPGPCVGFSAAA